MSINVSDDEMVPKSIPTDADARAEKVASQEEKYLETTEENLRAVLISEDASSYEQQETGCVDCCLVANGLDEELDDAAEELITGDSDDPPLSEGAVVAILTATSNARRLIAEENTVRLIEG